MSSVSSARQRRRLVTGIKESFRELSVQLSLLNHQVGAHLELRDVDLDCLDLIGRHGPVGPSALARRSGLHPATMTGILDRLQRGGWITRERDQDGADRRAVVVRATRDRNAEVYRLVGGMSRAMDAIFADYTDDELARFAELLRRTTDAGRRATGDLAD